LGDAICFALRVVIDFHPDRETNGRAYQREGGGYFGEKRKEMLNVHRECTNVYLGLGECTPLDFENVC
jgi:hypothetical protein